MYSDIVIDESHISGYEIYIVIDESHISDYERNCHQVVLMTYLYMTIKY